MGARVPERTCVGCRRTARRSDLIRLASSHVGPIVDPAASATGRGAWLHRDADCVTAALRPGVLARALRSDLSQGELDRLRSDLDEELTHE